MSLFITPSQALRIEQAAKKAWAAYLKQEKATVKEIIGYYQAAHKEIATELVLGKGIEFDRERLQALDRFILSRIEEITPPVKSRVSQSLAYAYQAKHENTLEQISIARNIAIPQIGIHWQLFTPLGIEAYSQFALQLCDQYNLELVNKIQQQLRLGFFERKSWTEIMRDVAEKAFGFKRPGSIPRKPKGVLYKIHRIVRTEMQRMRTFATQEGLETDQDIIGVHIQFGGGPCPGNVCPPMQGDYYKDGSDMGWPPPSIPFHPNCTCYDWYLYPKLS